MRRELYMIVALACVASGMASATTFTGVGNWTDPNLWNAGVPTGAVQADIAGPNTVCTLNTSTGDWGSSQRMTVDGGATLLIQEGAEMLGGGWVRVGVSGIGNAIQTGGLVRIANDKLGIGDKVGGVGHYTMLGGTLTFDGTRGDLAPGSRDGVGTFTVVGTAPVIEMGNLIVSERGSASGTVEFKIDANGVSPINLTGQAKIDIPGDPTTSALIVSATDAPPMRDIVLVNTTSDNAVVGVFDTINGKPAPEGAEVTISGGGFSCTYALTYVGGTGNDVVLVFKSAATRPTIVYVTDSPDINGDGLMDDQSVIDWLTAEGYNVDARRGYWQTLDAGKIAELNAADLVIASCGLSTGNYDDGDEPTQWNSLTTPMINFNSWLLRTSRWKWMNSGTAVKDAGAPLLKPDVPAHPIFAGVELDPNGLVAVLDASVDNGQTSFLQNILDVGNGTLLATSVGTYTTAFIAEWAAGVEYYSGAAQFAGGPRMMFMATEQETGAPSRQGAFNLTAAGQQILRNMISYLAPDKPIVDGL
jgi:hypothetical protein